MNETHLHLLITHLPIFGSILGGFVLFNGVWNDSTQTKIAAYYVLIISSLGAIISYLTGEAAEETVENIPGVLKDTIEQHEDFAVFSLVALIVLGVLSVIGILSIVKNFSFDKKISFVILFVSLVSFALVAWTGNLGGKIRHTELDSSNSMINKGSGENSDD